MKSFNWKDVGVVAGSPRQLADQDYQICFRQETLNNNQVSRLVVCNVLLEEKLDAYADSKAYLHE